MKLDSRGALSIPLLMALVISTTSAFGLWGLVFHWRQVVELQLRLDRCVADASLDFKTRLEDIESSNRIILILRVSIAAATLAPEARPPLQMALSAAVIKQEVILNVWKLKQVAWLARRGCDRYQDWPTPLPNLPWARDPPDPIGPQALRWISGTPREFSIRLRRTPRFSAARISKTNKWNARWTTWASLP